MAKHPVGKLLPNLNVWVDPNKTRDLSSYVFDARSSTKEKEKLDYPYVEPVVYKPKIFNNKNSGFATGIDLLSEENIAMLSKRAERFGLDVKETPSIKELYESLGITTEKLNTGKLKHIRLNTLHVRGTNELSDNDVIEYFEQYAPSGTEWVSDDSCNVVFKDNGSAARALLYLSTEYSNDYYDQVKSKTVEPSVVQDQAGPSSTQGKPNGKSEDPCAVQEQEEPSSTQGSEDPNEEEEMEICSPARIDIPVVPPGKWRESIKPIPKAKKLIFRFATTEDKKAPGAEARSNYYKKHGNPHFNGITGNISSSMRRRYKNAFNKYVYTKTKPFIRQSFASQNTTNNKVFSVDLTQRKVLKTDAYKTTFMYADKEELKIRKSREMASAEKRRTLKRGASFTPSMMYADEEELKAKKLRAKNINSTNVHSRLGKKYTMDQLCSIGSAPEKVSERSYIEKSSSISSSSSDLREKLHRIRGARNHKYDSDDYDNDYKGSYMPIENKKHKPTFFKRKYRSPLIEDDDDGGEVDSDYSDST